MAPHPAVHTVKMPKWGLSMQEGTIVHWHVAPGDRVVAGAPFCDIETAKITNAFEAPASGTVARLLARPEEVVEVGRPIAIVAEDGAAPAAIEAAVEAAATMSGSSPEAGTRSTDPGLRVVEADGFRLAYRETAGDATADPVVFLHGWGGDHSIWAMTQEALAGRGRRTLAFDLPGHGASDKDVGSGSAEEMATRVAGALATLGLSRFALVAHSFGALTAVALAGRSGLAISPLILIAPVGFGPAPDPAYVRGFLGAERKRDMKPVMERLFANAASLGRAVVSDALASLRDEASRRALERTGSALLAIQGEALGASLARIKPDWHVIWGDRDAIVPLDRSVRDALGEKLHVVGEAGHMPFIEKAGAVNDVLERLLET